MKKYFLLIGLLCCAVASQAAEGRADEILRAMAARIRAMGNYGVGFTISSGEHVVAGRYTVGGDSYYMSMGDAEIYCDGKVRYEVNNRTKEVSIDQVDTKSRNILNNPTRAFDLVGGEYTSALLWERNGQAAIKLTPRSGRASTGTVIVTVDMQRTEPRSLAYDFDGDRVTVSVDRMAAEARAPKSFNRAAYKGYEFIDFR